VAKKWALRERCRTDVELFATVFFPHYCRCPFNQFHRDSFHDWSVPVRGARRASIAPRGTAKSTLAALIKPIHDLCYGLESFIVLLSNTDAQAAGRAKDIRRELLENVALRDYFGAFFSSRRVPETEFVATCGDNQIMFSAYGSGAEIRGIRFGERRPTKIICDDIEHSEEVLNEAIRTKYEAWFKEVVSQMGDGETKIEVIGTLLHPKALLKSIEDNPAYATRRYRSIISWSRGEKLWEQWRKLYHNLEVTQAERLNAATSFFEANKAAMLEGTEILWPGNPDESYLKLMMLREEIGYRAFEKERQNNPMESEDAIFRQLHWFVETPKGYLIEETGVLIPWSELNEMQGVIDPATGQTKARAGKRGDFSPILSGRSDRKGRLFVVEDWTRRATPTEFIAAIFEAHERLAFAKFGVEVNLYRNLLIPNLETERRRREIENKARFDAECADCRKHNRPLPTWSWGLHLPFYGIDNIDNKEKRIYTLEPKVANRYILFNKTLSAEFKHQMASFPLGDHDDCPDALEMLWGLVNKRYGASPLSLNAQRQ
jgi:predicted phage terminase large subunit-like protein